MTDRLAAHTRAAAALARLDDAALTALLDEARPHGAGIGGASVLLEVDGVRVFAKRVALTDLERRPEHRHSTRNLFGLPTYYQYGIGSAGFGAWRELAAHTLTTDWVLAGAYPGFPLLHHWRELPGSPSTEGAYDAFGGLDGAVGHWEDSPAVRRRLEAIRDASASIVLFLEYVPHTLGSWLAAGRDGDFVRPQLAEGTAFMSSCGFVHFDAHPANILTDGRRLYFADFGLALSADFDLSPAEADFLADHLPSYDLANALSHLTPEPADEHAASLANDFHRALLRQDKRTPYPAAAIARALAAR